VGAPIDLDEAYSFGSVVLRNAGDEPAVLDRLTLIDPSPGLEVVGMYTLPVPNARGVGFIEGFHPEWGEPVAGSPVSPGRDLQVVIGVRVAEPGRYEFRGVLVDYRVDDARHRANLQHSLRVCAPFERYERRCPGLLG